MQNTEFSFIFTNTNLSSTAKLVYCIMHSYKLCDDICYLTAQQIADIAGCHRNSVTRAIDSLEFYFAIEPRKTLSIKNRLRYVYRVNNEEQANDWSAQKELERQTDYHLEKDLLKG